MDTLTEILQAIRDGKVEPSAGEGLVRDFFYRDLGHTKIDRSRIHRTGYPEVIYCAGKTVEQVVDILEAILGRSAQQEPPLLCTRVTETQAEAVLARFPELRWNRLGRVIFSRPKPPEETGSYIAVVTAGTSDQPVAEEAAVTAEVFGNRVERVFDVGVAGIHRLMDKIELVRGSKVLVVAAGMEGALPSVVAGLVDKPVIAVPTSVGYGASFGGLSALLAMLNSCAPGMTVVNIDNGFGAGYVAGMINSQGKL
jgi:NCAIR mutase (PurE)-related protein